MLQKTSTCSNFFLSLLAAVMLTLASVGSASATSVLTPGLSVTSGGLTFSNFTCDSVGSGTHTGGCSSIGVTPLTPQPAGISLSTALSASGVSSVDGVVTFDVSAPMGVNTVGLAMDSTYLGLGVDSVTETVYASLGGPVLGDASVICSSSSGCAGSTSVVIQLSGTYTSLYITKDISLSSYSSDSAASIVAVTQTFTEVPEPMSIALVGSLLILSFMARSLPVFRR
jgi:hypothetical protein